MRKFFLAAVIMVIGIGAGAAFGFQFAEAASARPLWSYHSGNTLQAHPTEYRRGYYIGVIDGYLQGHMRAEASGDNGRWLDQCLSGGWTLKRADRDIAKQFENVAPKYANPAADIVLDGLETACAKK